MEKVVYSGTAAIAFLLIIGSYLFASSLTMSLASDSAAMNVARLLLIAAMAGILFLPGQMNLRQRKMLTAVSIGCAVWAFLSILNGSSDVLDAVLFALAGCSFGLAVLQPVAPAYTELELTDFNENWEFEPVYGARSVFWRSFRPEMVSYGWTILAAAKKGTLQLSTAASSSPKQALKLATN